MNPWDGNDHVDEQESYHQWNHEHYRFLPAKSNVWAWVTGVALVMLVAYLIFADITNGLLY